MIKAIVFDLWNTLINGSKMIDIEKGLAERLNEFNFSPYHFFNFGHGTWMSDGKGIAEKYFEEYCTENDIDKKHIVTLEEYWNSIREEKNILINGMPKLVKKLKKNYKLGLLSNTGLSGKEIFESKEIKNHFDVITYSFEEWIVKPNENIYARVCRRLDVKPSEAIFIDDIQSFVNGAKYLGMDGILFKGVKDLKKELKKRGIKA